MAKASANIFSFIELSNKELLHQGLVEFKISVFKVVTFTYILFHEDFCRLEHPCCFFHSVDSRLLFLASRETGMD